MNDKSHLQVSQKSVLLERNHNQNKTKYKQCGFCNYLLDYSLISQSGLIGQSGRGGAGCPNCPCGPGGSSGPSGPSCQGGQP